MDLVPESIEALVFDIGGVFLIPHPEPIIDWYSVSGHQLSSDPVDYHRAHHRGVRAIYDSAAQPDELNPDTWSAYDAAYFGLLGVPPPSEKLRQWDFPLQANIEAMGSLAAFGLPMAVVSNNNGTAEQQLLDAQVAQVGPGPLPAILSVTDSAIIGVAKPDPAIFAPVLGQLGLPAERVLYVGDTVHADVAGARAAGMSVVQLDPFDDHADLDHARVADLPELVGLLSS